MRGPTAATILALMLAGCSATDEGMLERYGTGELQEGAWFLPEGDGTHPVVVLVHGGCYQGAYDRHLEDEVAGELASEGYAVWNIEYRPPSEAPYPATFEDITAAIEHLPESRYRERLDLGKMAYVGHSAGGHLALWAGSKAEGAPEPAPQLVVAQAPLSDLTYSAQTGVCGNAVAELLGGTPEEVPERYRSTDPALLEPRSEVVLLHGTDDEIVPLEVSRRYQEKQPETRLVEVPGGHFEHLEAGSEAVEELTEALTTLEE